ncbi:MAG TPA: hypothetical protein H9670_03840 [Firmicutes bacterium]|nr:hypothetical protein [Bacillota bacterium]
MATPAAQLFCLIAFFRKDAAKRFINGQIPKRQTDCKPRYFHTSKRSKRHGYSLAKRLRTDRKTAPSTGKTKNEAADKQEKMIVTASKVQNGAAKEQWQAKKWRGGAKPHRRAKHLSESTLVDTS